MTVAALASFFRRSTTFSFPGMTMSSGAKLPSLRSTPILFLGRSLIWPTEASTVKAFPRYLLIVFALAGDSTITSDLLIAFLKPDDNQGQHGKTSSNGTDCTTWKVQGYLLIVIRVWTGASTRAAQVMLSPALSATSASATMVQIPSELYIRLT